MQQRCPRCRSAMHVMDEVERRVRRKKLEMQINQEVVKEVVQDDDTVYCTLLFDDWEVFGAD